MRAEEALALAKSYVKKSLVGAGALKGKDGKDGTNGKSAYEIAKANGFGGTEQEWLESLKGEAGSPGDDGADGKNGQDLYVFEIKEDGHLYVSGSSTTINNFSINENGHLIYTLGE